MKLQFIVDANLPPDLVNVIRKFDCDAVHVYRLEQFPVSWNYPKAVLVRFTRTIYCTVSRALMGPPRKAEDDGVLV